ncbi:MAG: hypothetical protein QE263_01110 [Vampirovibrionales bacterium]|nr:hypothetical protein [Vampirovibrionales bacterium]
MTPVWTLARSSQRLFAWVLALSILFPAGLSAPSFAQYQNPYQNQNPYATQPYGGQSYSAPQQNYSQSQMAPLQGYVVTVPAGTYAQASLQTPISSATARAGDRFMVTLAGPLMSGNTVALPSGTLVEGQVISAMAAGRAGRNGQLDIRFTSAALPNGQRVPLSARLQTEDGTGVLKGGTGASRAGGAAARAVGGAALGAALGTAMGPLSGGSVGRGAIYGTILGSGLGAVAAGVNKGEDVALNSGAPVNLVLDAPVTTSADSSNATSLPQYNQQNYSQQGYSQTQPYGATPSNGSFTPYPNNPNTQPYNPYQY